MTRLQHVTKAMLEYCKTGKSCSYCEYRSVCEWLSAPASDLTEKEIVKELNSESADNEPPLPF
jgi:hypothetical protein